MPFPKAIENISIHGGHHYTVSPTLAVTQKFKPNPSQLPRLLGPTCASLRSRRERVQATSPNFRGRFVENSKCRFPWDCYMSSQRERGRGPKKDTGLKHTAKSRSGLHMSTGSHQTAKRSGRNRLRGCHALPRKTSKRRNATRLLEAALKAARSAHIRKQL